MSGFSPFLAWQVLYLVAIIALLVFAIIVGRAILDIRRSVQRIEQQMLFSHGGAPGPYPGTRPQQYPRPGEFGN